MGLKLVLSAIFEVMNGPIILLSPSKGMNSSKIALPWSDADPAAFSAYTKNVVEAIAGLSPEQKKALFKVSDAMYPTVEALWDHSSNDFVAPKQEGVPGLVAYSGEAFKALHAESLSVEAQKRARTSLVVLSALYGAVSGGTLVRPYRLEMQSKLPVGDAKNLYALWKPVLTQWLNEQSVPFIIDACSGEYSKAVVWKEVKTPVVHVDFKQMKNGVAKSISAFSKQARGSFARWVLQENVQTIFGLASFNKEGYQLFSHEGDKMVFLRE